MTHSIKHLFHIDASKEKVFEAISTINGLKNWWTVETIGNDAVGGIIQFRFAANGGPDMKVIQRTFTFLLDDNVGKTRVRFSHDGWKENDDFYAICSFAWGRYMESLRQYCQTGHGEAFGSAGYRM
ncbi:MAG: SRPBCC domain-containing protein [Bacteroidetes bacterium]|nr:SRPBCC domain-containing protein [Bacteroidota bacterium]